MSGQPLSPVGTGLFNLVGANGTEKVEDNQKVMPETRDNCGYSLPAPHATPTKSAKKAPPKVEKSPPKPSPEKPSATGLENRHVSGPMKFVVGERTRMAAIEGVDAWRKKFATEGKWKGVLEKIKRVKEEDCLRLSGKLEDGDGDEKKEGEGGVRRSKAKATAWPGQTRPPTLVAGASSLYSPSTPRARWDIPTQGALTPLSATPTRNAFGPGGFWESLSPQPVTPIPATPITAILLPPRSPIVPKDPEACAAYDDVKHEVDKMALKMCASRLSIYSTSTSSTSTGDSTLVHPSMLKPHDELAAAEFVLRSQSQRLNLKSLIDAKLPQKLASCAKDEGAAIDTYSIRDAFELEKADTWLQLDPKTLSITTILDAQRDTLSMLRHRRKSRDLRVSEAAVRLAWGTRILEDAEAKLAAYDGSSMNSEEEAGYDYGNLLRMLRRDGSDVSSTLDERWSVGDLEKLRSRSTTVTTGTTGTDGSAKGSVRRSSSPKKAFTFAFEAGSGSSVFNTAASSTDVVSRAGTPATMTTPMPTPVQTTTDIYIPRQRHRHRYNQSKNLSISTTNTAFKLSTDEDYEHDYPPISPEDKEFRHQGPTHADLTSWAAQLKKLRTSISSSRSGNSETALDIDGVVHPALRSSFEERGRRSGESGRSNGDGRGKEVEREMSRGRQIDRVSRGSQGSWRCVGAASLERQPEYQDRQRSIGLDPQSRSASRAGSIVYSSMRAGSRVASRAGSRASSTKDEEEDEWESELKRMEGREVMRQRWG